MNSLADDFSWKKMPSTHIWKGTNPPQYPEPAFVLGDRLEIFSFPPESHCTGEDFWDIIKGNSFKSTETPKCLLHTLSYP